MCLSIKCISCFLCFFLADDDIFIIKRAILDVPSIFEPLKNLSLKMCEEVCYQTPGCNSFMHNKITKSCLGNNATHLTHDLKPSKKGWETYIINPGQ